MKMNVGKTLSVLESSNLNLRALKDYWHKDLLRFFFVTFVAGVVTGWCSKTIPFDYNETNF